MSQKSRLVYSVREYPSDTSDGVVLFFCPFGVAGWQLALPGMPIWRLKRAGFSVVAYSYKRTIATASLDVTLANITAMLHDAEERLREIPADVEIHCFGASMGTVMAASIAARYQRIKKIVLNLSYSDISDHILALPSIPAISSKKLARYLATVSNETELRQALQPYSPLHLANNFAGKRVLLYSNRRDKILKYIHTRQFREALEHEGVALTYYENRFGSHYSAALWNYLRYHRYINFLKQD